MKYIKYHKDRTIWAKGEMVNNKMEGYWEFFRKDGTIMRSGYFSKGEQTGEWKTFDRKGNLIKRTYFNTGKSENVDEYINSTIKKLNNQNINDLFTLYKLFIEETGAFMPLNLKKNIKKFLKSKLSGIYISYSNNIPTGFVEYRVLENKLRDDEGVIEITSLFTHKDYRKSGIAKELIKKIVEISLKNNCTRIVLYSGLELVDAHIFYEKIGFKKKAYYFSKNIN